MSKGGTESKWNENKSTWNKWGPLRVHRMNSKVQFWKLTGWRSKNDKERLKIFAKSPTETLRKHYGSASAWIFFTETIFFTNFKWSRITRRAEHFSPSLLPLFIGKWGRSLPPSSPRRARLLPLEATAFWRNILEGPSGLGCYLHPIFTKYTPLLFFGDPFSVTLRNFTNFVTMLVFFP